MSRAPIGSLPWRSRSQHDLASKSCPAHNFVIWSRILKLFHRNDHHIATTCRAQHLGYDIEGQGHTMTLQQNRVRSITLLFEVGFYNYFWQTTSLCPIPIRGALPGSCLKYYGSAVLWNNVVENCKISVTVRYRGTINRTELIKNYICYLKTNIKSQQYKQDNVLVFYSYYFSKASNLQTKKLLPRQMSYNIYNVSQIHHHLSFLGMSC